MNILRDGPSRRRAELNPITTSLATAQHPFQTPNSALSSNSLSAPFGYNPVNFTPVSAVRQYNPQQWTASPVSSDTGLQYTPIRPQDPEVVVPAPPPYSPPRSQRPAASEGPAATSSPAFQSPSANAYRSSPEPSSNPVFAPPPSSRMRAASNDRQPGILHNLTAFARRPAPDAARQSPEINREPVPNVRRPVPISTAMPHVEEDQLIDQRPPNSRRAVSAGATSTPSSSRSRTSSTSYWEPGMPLPPPPPGPPPQSRSQSMTRTTDRVTSPPTRRPGPLSNLGPVPPTPAGWVEEDIPGRGSSPNRGLTIDTSSISSSSHTVGDSTSGSSNSGLSRARAVRGEPKSIRERRSESRSGKSIAPPEEPSNNPWAEAITPSDIVVPFSGLTRRPTVPRSTPRSARSHQSETPKSANPSNHNTPVQAGPHTGGESRGSTPRPTPSSSRLEAPTPPFSPSHLRSVLPEASPAIPPRALPTPPLQSRSALGSPARPYNTKPESAGISHSRPPSQQSNASQLSGTTPAEQFARSAIERHRAFAQKEAAAATDTERVRIFAEFIVNESRMRRERYAGAIDAMGSEILELTRDLFRPFSSPRRDSTVSRSSEWTPDSSIPPRSHRGSLSAAMHDKPQMISVTAPSPGPPSPALGRPESTWWTGYMPSLSPIPSMSVSEALDESDSRGRPSSRWWEVSQEGSTGTPSMRLERSKRESKYMGMPRELREALQYENGEPASTDNGDTASGPSSQKVYGPDEYPPEKSGWNDEPSMTPSQRPSKSPAPFSPAPFTPNPNQLDVSRLVTLPPPYPRHHPAVNNNHPDLTSIRSSVRTLSDFTEIEATKSRFLAASAKNLEELSSTLSKKRASLRANITREIAAGTMTYASAAAHESSFAATEADQKKEASKADFELFQVQVVTPLNDLLMDRVARATALFDQLRSQLFVDAQQLDPNTTQEEGDEQPELLEKLTLLKWIFEAREQLHRALFDLLSDRNDRYRDMIITPYKLAGNEQKVVNAQAFFAEDAGKRRLAFEQEVLTRTEEFMDIIEANVVRGVEVQLSAFWDIAPGLSRVTEKIPLDLHDFEVQIPAAEFEENPAYYEHPLQYLYSLLGHCEKSTYQFIESQTNLLCLLHEVKTGVTGANTKLMRTQRILQGEDEGVVEQQLVEVERDEEVRLTDDLKEKVRCVEELWGGGLGSALVGVKERVGKYLRERGGWDEEEGV